MNKIKIISAGDVGNEEESIEMSSNVVKQLNPDLIILGGDLAYDNNIPQCYLTWDYFLKNVPHYHYESDTNITRVIPMILGVGNHDMGATSFTKAPVPHNAHQPIYKHWFPQHTVNGSIPNLSERSTYFDQKIGNKLHIISLDAEYLEHMAGAQTEWLEKVLSESDAETIIVQYHGPIYPACDPEDEEDYLVVDAGTQNWLPLFDKYNVKIVSENHSHAFKRTKKIKDGKEDPNGTTYLGEGNWGARIPPEGCQPFNVELIEKVSTNNNIWVLEVDGSSSIKATAYTEKGEVLDEVNI